MSIFKPLQTERLTLRTFDLADAKDVQRLAGRREIAATTLAIPHPYEDGMAEDWIARHEERREMRQQLTLAITLRQTGELIGAIGLEGISSRHRRAELGYWIGVPHWGKGYCTEAARAVIDYAFRELDLRRIDAHHMGNNPASGRVMQKLGMKHEGCLREHIEKWGEFHDAVIYGVLRSEWLELA